MQSQLAALATAAQGLLLPSESDAPFEIFYWRRSEWDAFLCDAAQQCLSVSRVAEFFEPHVLAESWMDADEIATCERMRVLQDTIETQLPCAAVWKVGEKVYICGRVGDGMGGLKSKVVET